MADISLFDEETDKTDLTIATAVATIFWNWHPNALRALLDRDRFYKVSWSRTVPPIGHRTMVITEKNDRALTVGIYSTRDSEWLERCDIGIEASGKWTLLSATMYGSYITNPAAVSALARNLAWGLIYGKVHEPGKGEKITLKVSDLDYKAVGGYPTNPHVIYERLDPSTCVQCLRLPADLRRNGEF